MCIIPYLHNSLNTKTLISKERVSSVLKMDFGNPCLAINCVTIIPHKMTPNVVKIEFKLDFFIQLDMASKELLSLKIKVSQFFTQ